MSEETASRHGLDRRAGRWRPHAATAADARGRPVLSLDDYSWIPFVKTVVGVAWYEYRARLRCGDGDVYAVSRPDIEGYEAYNREYLGLGRARRMEVALPAGDFGIALGLRKDPRPLRETAGVARRGGGMLVHPYMSIEPVWELAEALAAESGVPVKVMGPLPDVTRLANDKARFSELVESLVGPDALVHTATARDPRRLAERLGEYALRFPAVALKMPSCASGMGNRIFHGPALAAKPAAALLEVVERFLEEKEWDGREEVLVVEWRRDVLESPSTQCWIPPVGEGEPVVEEVYQQFLLGEEQVFEGAMLSGLPRHLRHDFMVKSWLLCGVLQRLGYAGRCSFDALVVGRSLGDASVKFVECNGRWGGTSTPMHLVKRVFGDFRRLPYKAQDYVDGRLEGLGFPELMDVFGDQLYDRRTGRGRVLLYNVGGVTDHGKFDVVVTGRTWKDVEGFIERRIPRLIERYVRGRRPQRRAIL